MPCEKNTLDSNLAVLSFAEEECLRELPVAPQWFAVEPNSFGDFGVELTKAVRTTINPSRQRRKGRTVSAEAQGGWNTDFTRTSLNRLLQGFMFADARELSTTRRLAVPVGADYVSAVGAGTVEITTAQEFLVGGLVYMSGFASAANNGIKNITAVTELGGVVTLTVNPATVAETVSVPERQTKHAESCGYVFPADDLVATVSSGKLVLTTTARDFTDLPNIVPGSWVFIGGDVEANRFAAFSGYARIETVSETVLTFDDTTFAPVADTGAGVTVRMFVGVLIRNEKAVSLIKQRSYQLERTLGVGATSTQAEYLVGAIANELSLEIPADEKLAADLTFVGCDMEYRTGESGDEIKTGTRYDPPLGEEAYNSSLDVYRMKVSILSDSTSNLPALVGYASEASITITNNAAPNTAISVFGALDFQLGDFEVGGSITAYFTEVSAQRHIREDSDVGFNIIGAYQNSGFVFDMPLLTLSGGSLTVEKDAPIQLPLEPAAVEGKNGYTLMYVFFPYLPDLAMPE